LRILRPSFVPDEIVSGLTECHFQMARQAGFVQKTG
jgi:hypothetical protein